MANPTQGDLHISVPLTNLSVAWMQDENQFVASRVFPNVPVQQQFNRYYIYERSDWIRPEAQKRGPGAESAGSGWRLSNDTYMADVWAVHKDNSDQDYANADSVFNLDQEATAWVSLQMRLRQEAEFVSTYMQPSVWDTDQTGVNTLPSTNEFTQWDLDDSTPIQDIRRQIIAIRKRTGGFAPNTLILGPEVYDILVDHPTILSRIQYSERAIVSQDLLASLFGIDRVMVPFPVVDAAKEGLTESIDFSFGKSALLAYAAPRPGIRTPSAGYSFTWTGYIGASALGTRMKRFRMEENASWRIEGETAFDMKVVDTGAAVFFDSAVS
jgi:hypothetical protein